MLFTDLQINGCFGVDFNCDSMHLDQFQYAAAMLKRAGTGRFLATVITDDMELMLRRVTRIAEAIESQASADEDQAICAGIHIEGPFLSNSTGYIGAHPAHHSKPASVDDAKRLIEAGQGYVKVLTLAPERDMRGDVTKYLCQQGIIVAAGHTNATRDELLLCIDQGLRMITHFGNACPAELPRHDNVLWRMVSVRQDLLCGIIADGHHLPLWLIPVIVDLFGLENVFCVSDAISAAGLGPGTYTLGARSIQIGGRWCRKR